MSPRALVEKPSLDGKEEKCYSGSEQLGRKGGCWPGDGERTAPKGYCPSHLCIFLPKMQRFQTQDLLLQVFLISLSTKSIPLPPKKQNTIFRIPSLNHHTECCVPFLKTNSSVNYHYLPSIYTWFLGLSPISHLFQINLVHCVLFIPT